MSIIINPGSGPVAGATYANACDNIAAFASEIEADSWEGSDASEDHGRWLFDVKRGDRSVEVEMPGLPLDRVRYLGAADQNIWDFPRLYVDGSSWVWCYGISIAADHLSGEDED